MLWDWLFAVVCYAEMLGVVQFDEAPGLQNAGRILNSSTRLIRFTSCIIKKR
jgi:hypothetical protein